jgi:hypothetical protein
MKTYKGIERRHHKLYVTLNTEYHLRDDICVGVKDRKTAKWLKNHMALGHRLLGSIRFKDGGAIPNLGLPRIGESLYFLAPQHEIITSSLVKIERPEKEAIKYYKT